MSANDWWVVPEGVLGKIVSALSNRGVTLNLFTVKQSAAKPPGAVAGPFGSQDEAQASADKLNQGATATPGNIAKAAAQSASGSVLAPLFQANLWVRVAEVVAGLILLAIGVNAMFKGRPLAVVTGAAGGLAKAVP